MLLGTGTPNAEPERSGSSVAVVIGTKAYLVDFGPGVVRRCSAAAGQGIEPLRPVNLTTAFVTHLHSDHTAGYPDLILTPWVLGREQQMEVYGPPGLRGMTEHIMRAYSEDIVGRLNSGQPANDTGYRVETHDVTSEGTIYEDDMVSVRAIGVRHGSSPAHAYRFETPEGAVVVSGDTAPFEGWREACSDCSLLVHEVYSARGLAGRGERWREYHRGAHTSGPQLAELASAVRPGLLILYHQLLHGVEEDELLEEITGGYDGPVCYGRDLDVFEVGGRE